MFINVFSTISLIQNIYNLECGSINFVINIVQIVEALFIYWIVATSKSWTQVKKTFTEICECVVILFFQ